ncbi:alpha/beta hydrolase [uncultured Thalassolituus sp.]|uniref:alpha/beta fold hydrolase n=1 Tax=uncultured Thalassolituus sp. TaxID=285273 RepID=UPI002635ED5D|nr:alpha/beta hydrolase [uncultured Thalassolituus sp.]
MSAIHLSGDVDVGHSPVHIEKQQECLMSLPHRFLRYMGLTPLSTAQMADIYANEDSRFFQYRGDNIHYRIEGRQDDEAPVMVMLHGIMASLQTWDGWVEQLKDKYRIVRLDVPAFGVTGAISDNDTSIEGIVDRLNALVNYLNLDRFILAGNSLGGYISWEYAAAHPERVSALILQDAAGYPMPLPWLMKLFTTPVIRHAVRLGAPQPVVRVVLNDVYGDKRRITADKIPCYQDMMLHKGNPLSLLKIFEELDNMSADRVPSVKAPTLIQWGEKDRWIPPANAALFKRDIENSELIMYPGVGHVPMEEIPELSAKDAHEFLTRVL